MTKEAKMNKNERIGRNSAIVAVVVIIFYLALVAPTSDRSIESAITIIMGGVGLGILVIFAGILLGHTKFPIVERTYQCNCCNDISKKVFRELWIGGTPILKLKHRGDLE